MEIDPRYFRPTEVEFLFGRCQKGKGETGLGAKGSVQRISSNDGRCRRKELEELKRCQDVIRKMSNSK